VQLADRIAASGKAKVVSNTFFNEFTVQLPKPASEVVEAMAKRGILAGVPVSRFYPDKPELAKLLLVTATEVNSDDDMARFCAALGEVL
jgi:glycine dehydrogenase subunit 1